MGRVGRRECGAVGVVDGGGEGTVDDLQGGVAIADGVSGSGDWIGRHDSLGESGGGDLEFGGVDDGVALELRPKSVLPWAGENQVELDLVLVGFPGGMGVDEIQ